jgi:hypothetical protein
MLPALESEAAVSDMSLAIQRQKIMLFHNIALGWLDHMIVRLASKLRSPPNYWVQSVAFDFYTMINSNASTFKIRPPVKLHALPGCPKPYRWIRNRLD